MAFVERDGVKIHWAEQGSGEPLLMLMGLGYSHHMWQHIVPFLEGDFRLIMLDNRGVGLSDVPQGTYHVEDMVADAVAVMDAAGVDKAHVFGVSMGGYIAQTLAYTHPERVRGLVLGASATGGHRVVPAAEEVLDVLRRRAEMEPEESVRALVPYIYAKATPQEQIDEDLAVRMAYFPDPVGYAGQMMGIMAWTSAHHLEEIVAPTLLIHGVEDQLVPPGNSDVLLEGIPNARLEHLENASHIFFTDQPAKASKLVIDFLKGLD